MAGLGYLQQYAVLLVGALVGAFVVFYYFSVRKKILFEAWVNMYADADSELGRSVAELLLFNIRSIKRTHEETAGKVDLWNPIQDVPAFKQGLDEDIQLLASVELGKYGTVVSKLVMVLFKLLPLILQPDRLKGSIHKYGKDLHFLASLDQHRNRPTARARKRLWQITGPEASLEKIPEYVEELAYRIYLDLTGERLFKTWQAFRAYTDGLRAYLVFTDLDRKDDLEDAQAFYLEALEWEEGNPVVLYNLGVLNYQGRKWQAEGNRQAIDYFRRAANSESGELRVRVFSALANALATELHRFWNDEFLEEALELGREAIHIAPGLDSANKAHAYISHQAAELLERRGGESQKRVTELRREAIKHYERAYGLNKQHYIAHNNLGNLYLEWSKTIQNEKERSRLLRLAAKECEAAVRINPSYHHAHDNLGNIYLEQRVFKKAHRKFRDALRMVSGYPEGTNDIALVHLVRDLEGSSPERAVKYHADALELAADSEGQRRKLCRTFCRKIVEFEEARLGYPQSELREPLEELTDQGCFCHELLLEKA